MARPTDEDVKNREEFLKIIAECALKPSLFSEVFLEHVIYDYNKQYVDSNENYIIYRSGRQAGKTMSTAVKAIHYAFFAPLLKNTINKREGCTIIIAAPTQNQAAIMFGRIQSLVESSPFLKQYIVRTTKTEMEVRWLNGEGTSKIITRATGERGESLRGYCIKKGEYVYGEDKVYLIDDLKDGDRILGGSINGIHEFEDELIKIRFYNGTSIEVNGEHPFMTQRGWVKACNLNDDDTVEFIKSPINGTKSIGKNRARLLGYLFSDGYKDKNHVEFFNTNSDFTSDVSKLVQSEFGLGTNFYSNGNRLIFTQQKYTKTKNILAEYLNKNKLLGSDLGFITELINEELVEFVNGVFNGDGCLSFYSYINNRYNKKYNKVEISFAMGIHKKRAIDFQYILWKLGINSIMKKHTSNNCWYVKITNKDNLLKLIDILDNTKYPDKFIQAKILLSDMNDNRSGYNGKYIRIKSIEHSGKGTVIGFEVNPTHEIISYLGMRTHNSPHVIIADECAFIKRDILIAFLPSGLATQADIWLTSTPYGRNTYFYECHTNSRPFNNTGLWKEYHVKSTDNPTVKANPVMLQQIKNLTQEEYIQEVEGEFLDIGDAMFPHSLLMDCLSDKQPSSQTTYYLAVDVARSGKDETVYTLIKVDESSNIYLELQEAESQSNLVGVANRIAEYCKNYPVHLVYIDETGLGGGVVDMARTLQVPVRGVVFTMEQKTELYTNLRVNMENKRVHIRDVGSKLLFQLGYLRREYTEQLGKLKIVSDAHDDYADSFALACSAVSRGDSWHVIPMSKELQKAMFG